MSLETILTIELRCTEGSSSKFWSGTIARHRHPDSGPKSTYTMTARYGRIGTPGHEASYDFSLPHGAFSRLFSKLKEKFKKGYVYEGSAVGPSTLFVEPDLKIAMTKLSLDLGKITPPLHIPGLSDLAKSLPFAASRPKESPPFYKDEREDTFVAPCEGFFS